MALLPTIRLLRLVWSRIPSVVRLPLMLAGAVKWWLERDVEPAPLLEAAVPTDAVLPAGYRVEADPFPTEPEPWQAGVG